MHIALLTFLLAVAQAPLQPVPVHVSSGPHPRVTLTVEELAPLRARATTQEWAKPVAQSIISAAQALVAEPLDIPHAGGQWTHWYSCKRDGGALEAKSPTEHVCKVCGTVYTGWPYDDVYITHRHHHWIRGMSDLGVAYALDPKPEYAERIKAILLEYASFYTTLPLHDKDGKDTAKSKAHLFAQTLDESVALCQIAGAYDLVYDAPCFTPDDHQRIETGFLRPMVETIQTNDMGISNWQSWHNAGVALAGFVLGDAALVEWAVNGTSGFVFQMANSVTASGMWYEEAPSYHWYALSAHVYLLEAAARAGMDLYTLPPVKKMFDAPQRQVFPDGTSPALNDSARTVIANQRDYYEVAFRRFQDPAYLPLLKTRDSVDALLWGVDTLPTDQARTLALVSSNEPSEGLAILRDATGQTAVFFDYGPGTSGHVHPAKLGLILYAHGDERFVDPGHLPYGNPMHRGWFTQTLAHNTVVVNEESQTRRSPKLLAFAATPDFSAVRAVCEGAYKGVVLDRTLCLAGNTVLDVFHCTSEEEATFDLPLHVHGEIVDVPEAKTVEAIGAKGPYTLLKNPRRFPERLNAATVDAGDGKRIALRFLDVSASYMAEGFGPGMKRLPMLLRRQQGTEVWFVAAYQILAGDEAAKAVDATITESGAAVSTPTLSLRTGALTQVLLPREGGAFAVYNLDATGAHEAEVSPADV
ncbi:MAG: alginate lyase family protein [Candidatus Hydrogenedentes bacterium]|nr:alginate lyase family protein [Candidatus Hydrogenedentota bacterium]